MSSRPFTFPPSSPWLDELAGELSPAESNLAARIARACGATGAPTWVRVPEHDRRIARGDDFAGDAWRHLETGELRYVAVGRKP